jgi:hypothetical protein
MWLKLLAKMDQISFEFLNHVLKKIGKGRSHNLFSINVFLNLHALGYPKLVTIFSYGYSYFWAELLGQQVPQHDVKNVDGVDLIALQLSKIERLFA